MCAPSQPATHVNVAEPGPEPGREPELAPDPPPEPPLPPFHTPPTPCSAAVSLIERIINHGTDPKQRIRTKTLINRMNIMPGSGPAPRELMSWLRATRVLRPCASHANLWDVEQLHRVLLLRCPTGVRAQRIRSIFGELPGEPIEK